VVAIAGGTSLGRSPALVMPKLKTPLVVLTVTVPKSCDVGLMLNVAGRASEPTTISGATSGAGGAMSGFGAAASGGTTTIASIGLVMSGVGAASTTPASRCTGAASIGGGASTSAASTDSAASTGASIVAPTSALGGASTETLPPSSSR